MTAKTRAIPSLHRDQPAGGAKVPARQLAGARMLCRVTQPPHIAGPLAQIFKAHGLSPRAMFKMFNLDKKISAL